MHLLNLGLAEFLALSGVMSALVVTLYLLSRARRRQTVATLRFWVQAMRPEPSQQRRRIQQPLSLLLQLLALLLLMLAIAQPRLGSRDTGAQDHVLVLDTSSWMAAGDGKKALIDEAKQAALTYLDRVPATDRIMLIRADGLPVPATPMTEDREELRKAIEGSRPGAAAMDLQQTLSFANEARQRNAQRAGEIVLIGSMRTRQQDAPLQIPANLRVIPVRHDFANCGLEQIGLRRSPADPGLWDILVTVRNYGKRAARVPVTVQFGGAPVGGQAIVLAPQAVQELNFHLRTRAAGWLEARLLMQDALPDDNRAMIEIPEQRPLKVAVYTRDSSALRPLLASNPYIDVTYATPGQPPAAPPDVVVLDQYEPAEMPKTGVIWLNPPAGRAGRIAGHVTNAQITGWRSDHDICAGLHANRLELESADILKAEPGDVPIAEVEKGPVILARPGPPRMVLAGYHPGRSDSRFDVATPLLFANMLRWLKPEAFRISEVHAQTVGPVTVPLDADEADATKLKVADEHGVALPFDVRGRTLRFYAGTPGTVRVTGGRSERVYSLTLPEVADTEWRAPGEVRTGLPPRWDRPLARDIWQWLAFAALLAMVIEWLRYGRMRNRAPRPVELQSQAMAKKAS